MFDTFNAYTYGSCLTNARHLHSTGAILTPIFQATTYIQDSIDHYLAKGFSYSRTANPTVMVLEDKIAEIEHGYGAVCFATGMAATVTVMSAYLSQVQTTQIKEP